MAAADKVKYPSIRSGSVSLKRSYFFFASRAMRALMRLALLR